MPRKPLSPEDTDAIVSIGSRLHQQIVGRNSEVIEATSRNDPGRLADAIVAAQADLAEAYAQVTAIVARQR